MGWVDELRGKTVGLDTAPLIFYIKDHPVFADRLEPFFQLVESGDIQLVTSTVTLFGSVGDATQTGRREAGPRLQRLLGEFTQCYDAPRESGNRANRRRIASNDQAQNP